MKAVRQIVDYLKGRGALTREQLIHLASEGFLSWDEVYGADETEEPVTETEEVSEADDEHIATSYPVAPKPARRGKHGRGAVLDSTGLVESLVARSAAWPGQLTGLMRVGQRLAEIGSWHDAALVIRNADLALLNQAVADGLRDQDPTLGLLWDSIDMEDYRAALEIPGIHGSAINAFRAILATLDHNQLGKHGWLLKDPIVAQVYNLVQAQHRLLLACESVFTQDPQRLAAAIHRDHHWLPYWSFVLLYSARRGKPGTRSLPTSFEHRPLRKPPDEAGWLRAWCHAVGMDPLTVMAFLIEHQAQQMQRPACLEATLVRFLAGLAATDQGLIEKYFDYRLPEALIASQLQVAEDTIGPSLARIRQLLHDVIDGDPALRFTFRAEPPHVRATFLDDCLRARTATMRGLVETYFGPTADLVCPKAWD